MNRNSWTDADRAEHDAICAEAWRAGPSTAERVDAYLARVHDAAQAHRYFARDCEFSALREGAAKQLKSWRKRQSNAAVSYDGKLLTHTRVIGTTYSDESGRPVHTQALFDFMTREQLEAKARECVANIRAYRFTLHVVMKLLDLLYEHPDAMTPAEAAVQANTTVKDYLSAA